MLKRIAKLFIGFGTLIFPVVIFADSAKYCSSLEVALTGAWLVGNGVDTDYAINRTDLSSANSTFDNVPSGDFKDVDSNYKLGGGIALNYQSNCCFNIGASYFGIHHTSDDQTTAGTPTNPAVGPILIPPPTGISVNNALIADSVFSYHYIFANLELGSLICVISDCLTVNPKIGLSYARFKDHQSTIYMGLATPTGTPSFVNDEVDMLSRFRGFGPSIGTDICYLFCGKFSLFGNFRYSTLLGTLHGSFINTATDATGTIVPADSGKDNFRTNKNVVKLFQSELGLGYFYSGACHCVEIKAGYMYTQAIDAVNRIRFPDDTASSVAIKQIVNASFHGPFIRVSTRFGQ